MAEASLLIYRPIRRSLQHRLAIPVCVMEWAEESLETPSGFLAPRARDYTPTVCRVLTGYCLDLGAGGGGAALRDLPPQLRVHGPRRTRVARSNSVRSQSCWGSLLILLLDSTLCVLSLLDLPFCQMPLGKTGASGQGAL
jgi:hypothetical protein